MPPVSIDRAAQERHYRSVFESSLDAILMIDPVDGRVVDANGAALRIYDNETLVGSSILDVATDPAETRELLDLVMREGSFRFETVQRLANGTERQVDVNASATVFDGRPAILSIMRDVTERALAVRALTTSETRMRTVLENVAASVWTLSEHRELVFVAGQLQAVGGRRAESMSMEEMAALWAATLDEETMARIVENQRRVFESGEGYDIEYPFRRPDGTRGWLNDRASSVYLRDGVRYVDGATFDITERKEIEIQQREAAEFGRRAVRVQDLDELFADACRTVLFVLSSDASCFYRHDPVRKVFQLAALAGEQLSGIEEVPDRIDYAGGFVFAGTRPIAFDDLEKETRFRSPVLEAAGMRSGILAPVRGRTISVGGMIAISRLPRRFTPREIAFAQTIANAVAEAVERIEAERQVRRHQAQLADAQALAHVGSFEVDLATGRVDWSDELYRIMRLEPQSRQLTLEIVGSEFVDREVAEEIVRATLALPAGGSIERAHAMRAADGTTRYVHTRGTLLPGEHGAPPTVFGTVQDVTAQRAAENALHEREARLQLIVSRLPVIIWSTDERMRLTSIAGAGFAAIAEDWVRELDLELDQLLGVPRDAQIRANGALLGHPVLYDVSDGLRELRVHVEPLRDAAGTIVGTVGIAFDRTSQNRTERVLSQIAQGVVSEIGENFFRSAVASLAGALHADCVFIAARDGDGTKLRTIAMSVDGKDSEELLYAIEKTPCENVLRDGFSWFERGVRREFPEDEPLAKMGMESYAGVPIYDSRGEAIGLVAMMNRRPFARDAAAEAALRIYADRASAELDRARRERSLVDAKKYVENLIDSANVVIIENDLEGRVRLVNRAFETLTGRSRSEVVDTLVFDLFADGLDDWRRDADARRLALNEGRPIALGEQETESAVVAADGSKRILRLRSNDVRRDGEVVGTIFFGVDVTDSILAEAEQERLQEQVVAAAAEWRNTFDSVVTPIVIVDAAGTLTRVNHAATRLTERSFRELLGTNLRSISDAEPWTTAAALVQRIVDSGLRAAVEEARDSRGRTWNLSAVPLGGTRGRAPSVILVLSDISGIVDLQESLRASERMSAMGQLVAGVAHEVRNPLFGISAALDAFEAEFGRTEDVAEYVERLRSDADRLRRLMNDLLEYGRPAGLRLERQPFLPLVERSLRVCEPETLAKDVRVSLTAAPLPDVTIDHDRMLQVLKNVIENATAFTASGSEVTIDVRVEESFVVCSIADQGPGFRAEDIQHVFEPFFTRRRGGTGLGLAIVQRIVGDHGGSVAVRNREQGGALVELRLPV